MTAKCNLIIDSCCDLPLEMVQREGVYLVEFPFLFDTEQHLDDFGVSMPAKEFYDRMRKGNFPTTSQISIPAYTEVFERAAQSGIPTVYLSFSSALSGSYNVSLLVRDQLQEKYPDMQLHIVDTKLASVAEGALVYEALRQRDAGLAAEELVEWAEEARYFLNMMFMIDDLESLRRGGRIPDGVAAAGAKLDVKPMLTIDLEGKLTLKGVARGRKKGIRQLAQFYLDKVSQDGPSGAIVTGNADCPKDLERMHELIAKEQEDAMFLDLHIGPVIGTHVGPGMIAIVFWGQDRREDLSVADRIARKIKGGA